jgi:hypothetical protein
MAKHVLSFTFIIFVLAASVARSQTPSLHPVEHSNHYIVLLDASGSTSVTQAKRSLYRRVLKEDLLKHLFSIGFGQAIPPYNTQKDSLTLFQFGILNDNLPDPYTRLSKHDLLTEFIHPIYVRQTGVDAARAAAIVVPQQTYQYTILSWAKQLALEKLSSTDSQQNLNRTFLIVVSDGLPNENSPKAEIDMVIKWGGDNFKRVTSVLDRINNDYRFTDGQGKEAAAWSQVIASDDSASLPFFIEAYEVFSKSQMDWESKAASLKPLDDLRFEWLDTGGKSTHGILKADLSEDFRAWTTGVNVHDRFLSTGNNDELGSGNGLALPVTFDEKLTCEHKALGTSFHSSLSRTDPLLGTRTVRYHYRQFVNIPLSFTCTVWFASLIVVSILAIVAALLGLAYFIKNRFFSTQIYLDLPGMLVPVRIDRRGERTATALILPQEELEALSLRLPGRLKQWLFYNGATISIATDQPNSASISWSKQNDLPQLRLPTAQGPICAHWIGMPTISCVLNIQFRQGTHHSEVALNYPAALMEKRRSDTMTANDIKVWVALDLGSESMAAYYETADNKSGMIEMQGLSKTIMNPTETQAALQLELLNEKVGTVERISPRLWNRVSFKDRAQPVDPERDHATLCFAKDPALYEQSLFSFFHRRGGWPPVSNVIMPNPKILFQHQVGDIFDSMRVIAKNGSDSAKTDLQYVRLSPEMLIKDLTSQVIINFVLEAPELRRFEKKNIHLTITVPNVYSLPHGETIKRFIHESVPDLAAVEVLSESDSVAYYALSATNNQSDSAALKEFKRSWTEQFEVSNNLCLVTIDIGKGTTDLSCVLVQQPAKPRGKSESQPLSRRHSVQGKTGRSSGGNYLNHIFAKYFDNQLEKVGRNVPLMSEMGGLPFRFLKRAHSEFRGSQTEILAELEQLIEPLKAAMTENYEIDEQLFSATDRREKLERIANRIMAAVPTKPDPEKEQQFRSEFVAAMCLPNRLDPFAYSSLSQVWSSQSQFASKLKESINYLLGRRTPAAFAVTADGFGNDETAKLKSNLQQYVEENVDKLLDSLQSLVRAHQAVTDDRQRIDSSSFVVVSGQASQFKPLRKAMKHKCDDLGIPSEHVLTDLDAVALKEACCRGAVSFWQGRLVAVNPSELHGTYGCIDRFNGTFKAFDMKKLNTKGIDTVSLPVDSTVYVIYTPRSPEEVQDVKPELYDGATALIARMIGNSFTLRYDPESLSLKINDQELMIGSFGSVDSSIFEKVWPEILEETKF